MSGYLALADLHGKKTSPRYRKDDYKGAFIRKLSWAVDYANENDLRILIAGDLFESVREGIEILNMVVEVFLRAKYVPLAVWGQHDLQFHTKNMLETPIYNLALSGIIKLMGHHPFKDGNTEIFGSSFGEEIPVENVGSRINILLVHRCITPDTPPFFLNGAISAKEFISQHGRYDFIVSGDYHEPYTVTHRKTTLINCGPMMRNSKSLIDHKPCAWAIYDNGEVLRVNIPCQPASEVFDLEAIDFDKTHGISLDLSKLRELMETEYDVANYDSIVWAGFDAIKSDTNCVISKVSIEKALRGEQIW